MKLLGDCVEYLKLLLTSVAGESRKAIERRVENTGAKIISSSNENENGVKIRCTIETVSSNSEFLFPGPRFLKRGKKIAWKGENRFSFIPKPLSFSSGKRNNRSGIEIDESRIIEESVGRIIN